jgi:hypothetical protein
MSLAGIEPVGFRVKSDLRSHCAIVQPRLYDSAMAMHWQVTLNRGDLPFKSASDLRRFFVNPGLGLVFMVC